MKPELLETVEIETAPQPTAAVIWMHGLGADANDFVPMVPQLGFDGKAGVRFVFPNAPVMPVTINNGYRMRAWYDVTADDLQGGTRRADERGIRASQAAIELLIERELERCIAACKIVIAGFSQGGAIALATALRYPQRLAGVMALSTYLPLADSLADEASPLNQDLPIYYAHGTEDPVIPFELALRSRAALEAHGYRVETHDYPMQHSVCMEEVADISAWLARVLAFNV